MGEKDPCEEATAALCQAHVQMEGAELEEFVQMLRMAQSPEAGARSGRAGGQPRAQSFWSSFAGKAAVSSAVFVSAILAFRMYGHTLA